MKTREDPPIGGDDGELMIALFELRSFDSDQVCEDPINPPKNDQLETYCLLAGAWTGCFSMD